MLSCALWLLLLKFCHHLVAWTWIFSKYLVCNVGFSQILKIHSRVIHTISREKDYQTMRDGNSDNNI